jgi:hypothetical protein
MKDDVLKLIKDYFLLKDEELVLSQSFIDKYNEQYSRNIKDLSYLKNKMKEMIVKGTKQ